jgi:hypothetical protein
MLKLDELSGEVARLEKLRSNLEMVERMRKLEDETDSWLRLQQLAELLEAPDCCSTLAATVRSSIVELVDKLRASFTADVIAPPPSLPPAPVRV